MKIRIKNIPEGFKIKNNKLIQEMKEGGTIKSTLPPVNREDANIEAEKNETVLTDIDKDGFFELYNIGGKRHSEGGTPLNLPEQSFIYSDTRKMMFTKEELSQLGISSKKKMTPAAVSKKFPINKYIEVLKDDSSDQIAINSAEAMIKKNKIKLSQIAFMQEMKKDFEDGLPLAAYPYLLENGIDPEEFQAKIQEKTQQQEQPFPEAGPIANPSQQQNLQEFTGPPQGGPGMPPGQPQQGGGQDQMMQEIAQALQQGVSPEEIMQQLIQMGMPEAEAMQIIEAIMQGGQGPSQGPPQGGPMHQMPDGSMMPGATHGEAPQQGGQEIPPEVMEQMMAMQQGQQGAPPMKRGGGLKKPCFDCGGSLPRFQDKGELKDRFANPFKGNLSNKNLGNLTREQQYLGDQGDYNKWQEQKPIDNTEVVETVDPCASITDGGFGPESKQCYDSQSMSPAWAVDQNAAVRNKDVTYDNYMQYQNMFYNQDVADLQNKYNQDYFDNSFNERNRPNKTDMLGNEQVDPFAAIREKEKAENFKNYKIDYNTLDRNRMFDQMNIQNRFQSRDNKSDFSGMMRNQNQRRDEQYRPDFNRFRQEGGGVPGDMDQKKIDFCKNNVCDYKQWTEAYRLKDNDQIRFMYESYKTKAIDKMKASGTSTEIMPEHEKLQPKSRGGLIGGNTTHLRKFIYDDGGTTNQMDTSSSSIGNAVSGSYGNYAPATSNVYQQGGDIDPAMQQAPTQVEQLMQAQQQLAMQRQMIMEAYQANPEQFESEEAQSDLEMRLTELDNNLQIVQTQLQTLTEQQFLNDTIIPLDQFVGETSSPAMQNTNNYFNPEQFLVREGGSMPKFQKGGTNEASDYPGSYWDQLSKMEGYNRSTPDYRSQWSDNMTDEEAEKLYQWQIGLSEGTITPPGGVYKGMTSGSGVFEGVQFDNLPSATTVNQAYKNYKVANQDWSTYLKDFIPFYNTGKSTHFDDGYPRTSSFDLQGYRQGGQLPRFDNGGEGDTPYTSSYTRVNPYVRTAPQAMIDGVANPDYNEELENSIQNGIASHQKFYDIMGQEKYADVRTAWIDAYHGMKEDKDNKKVKDASDEQLFAAFNDLNLLFQMSASSGTLFEDNNDRVEGFFKSQLEKNAKKLGMNIPTNDEIRMYQAMYNALAIAKETGSDEVKELLKPVSLVYSDNDGGSHKVTPDSENRVSNWDTLIGDNTSRSFASIVDEMEEELILQEFDCDEKTRAERLQACTERGLGFNAQTCQCIKGPDIHEVGELPPYKTFPGDDMKVGALSALTMGRDKKYGVMQKYNPIMRDPGYVDDRAAVAATSGLANAALDATRNVSSVQGDAQTAIDKIQAERWATNTKIFDNTQAYNVAELNKANLLNDGYRSDYVDMVNTVDQNYDNTKAADMMNLVDAETTRMDNADKLYELNLKNKNYYFDPQKHQTIFQNEEALEAYRNRENTGSSVTWEKAMADCKLAYPNADPKDINDCAKIRLGQGGSNNSIANNNSSNNSGNNDYYPYGPNDGSDIHGNYPRSQEGGSIRKKDLLESKRNLRKWIMGI